ncbi:hypothetical protein B9T26_05545 [Acinetobacter sp. ANC 4169]|uniref:PD-(D/E)XK nuclease family protein n=1 Tax=Acinetobacter sp. ANC 4169 TaxID=1977879 RepID=UPI000A3331AC|nr:PD-(D/E)XK nuclease family protein [Acinetobacter sp. ANC 4169]OTG75448.1 hypothetical protein B9T26_05545 [Acinetobacter sp. ANC 4169]
MRKAKANGLMLNVWKTASLKTDEVRNSKVLKWFLDCYGDHGQKNAILLKFLQLLPEPFSKFQSENYKTIEECCPLGGQESRVDIEIDSREFLIFIEIKINAMEGQNQLQRYIDIARAKAGNRQWLIVYLTKDGKLPQRYQNNEGLFGLSWSIVAKQFKSHTKSADMNNRGIWLLSQFADHIKSFK